MGVPSALLPIRLAEVPQIARDDRLVTSTNWPSTDLPGGQECVCRRLRRVRAPTLAGVSGADSIRVVIVDDEALVRTGFQYVLDASGGIDVVGTADGADAVETVERLRPDVVLLDIRMPARSGLDVLADLRRQVPAPIVAILTTFDSDEHIAAALSAGAAGFLVKDTDPEQLPLMVRTLASGGVVFSPVVSRTVIAGYLRPDHYGDRTLVAALTDREREVLIRLALGDSNTEIGQHLYMSTGTVKAHVSTIFGKLKVATRVQAALVAERAGLLISGKP